eukprot:13694-Heterococcus_DN1.PRE.3
MCLCSLRESRAGVCTVLINMMLLRYAHDVHCVSRFYASPADDLTMIGKRSAVRVDSDARDGAPSADAYWCLAITDTEVVAKYAARVGQSFGTSSSTITVQRYHEIPDVTTAGGRYTFSDGVGNVSSALMRRIIER